MSIRVQWTGYGRDAAVALHARVAAAKAPDPLQPVTIVVPSNFVGVSVRRLLASGDLGPVTPRGAGVAGLTLLTVYRLAELLGAPALAAQGRRPVSTPVLAATVRGVLADDPGRLAPVVDHPATEAALVRIHRELSEVDDQRLVAVVATGERAADVVRLHRQIRERLAGAWYDEADLMAAAAEAAADTAPLLADLGTLLVYLPQVLPPAATRLLRQLARRCPVEVVAGSTGVPVADADVAAVVAGLCPGSPPAPAMAPAAATEVVSVSDAEDEVRTAVRRLVGALRDGIPLERMALLFPHPEPYARLVHEHLNAAGVPAVGAAVRPVGDRLYGRFLLSLMALSDGRARRQDVFRLLSGAPVRVRGQRAPVARWERVSRAAGVVHGRDDWDRRLARHAVELRSQAAALKAEDDPREWLIERHEREAADAQRLRIFALGLISSLAAASRATTWSALVVWARGLLVRYLGGEADRESWPEVERKAAESVEAALDRLAALDLVEESPTPATFRRTLELELDSGLAREGRLGEGVLIGPLSVGLGVDLDLVIVLGLAEGVLPGRVREDSLLPDAERAAAGGQLRPRGQAVQLQHRQFLAALAASGGARILSFPRGDLRRSTERVPSRWLLDTAETLDARGVAERMLPASAPWLTHSPSFAGGLRAVTFPATRQEWSVVGLGRHRAAGGRVHEHPLAQRDAALRRGVALVRARRSDAFTRFDGNLASLSSDIGDPGTDGRAVAPTRLEAWADCPHAYLMQHVLGVGVVDNPEELLELSPLHRGNLLHDCYERWLLDRLGEPALAPQDPWSAVSRAELARIVAEGCDAYADAGLVGYPLMWERDRLRILLDAGDFLDHDDSRRRELGVRPVAAEFEFGLSTAGQDAVTVRLPAGGKVRLRGRVDRLDAAGEGRLVVTDYKAGKSTAYAGIANGDPFAAGTKLQLPAYALAAMAREGSTQPVRAEYWFVTNRGGFKRVGYQVDVALVRRFSEVLGVIADGIARGCFPARPPKPGWTPWVECDYCDPDGLGTTERHADWQRKREDPALATYVTLAEPEVEA